MNHDPSNLPFDSIGPHQRFCKVLVLLFPMDKRLHDIDALAMNSRHPEKPCLDFYMHHQAPRTQFLAARRLVGYVPPART